LRYCDKDCEVLKSYEERFVVIGYLRVLCVPDLGVNLRKFRNKRRGKIRRLKEQRGRRDLLGEKNGG
jgi:hypothetical protein